MRKMNTGDSNTGNMNTGHRNAGDRNAGNWNTGHWNTGDRNTGDWNTGDSNTGNMNTGHRNTGHRNAGHWNTGHLNTGDRNTGDWNTGHRNTGNRNAGHWNTGHWNAGHWNTGNWNTGNRNTGFFCTDTPCAVFFDAPTNLTHEEANALIPHVELPIGVEWVPSERMSDDEKDEHPTHTITGGFLRNHELPYTESFPLAWSKMTEDERARWTSLPNFDADKFLEITGVDVRKTSTRKISIDGKDVEISEESYQSLKAQLLDD